MTYWLQKLYSFYILILVNSERIADHAYRWISGMPYVKRSQITPYLYIGGQYNLNALSLFRNLGITAIINMRTRARYSEIQLQPFKVLNLPTADKTAPSVVDLNRGIQFIEKEVKNGGKVYIHCHWGEGRGPTMGIAYLVSQGMSVEDAIDLVKKNRRFISITKSQLARLQEISVLYPSILS